jgi:RNA polymerase sigma-70 factor, ECF subfamily
VDHEQAIGVAMTRPSPEPRARATSASPDINALFREHASFVWRALSRLKVPPADIDDALQEVFLVVVRKLDHYEDRGSVRGWLFSIARQVAMHARRSAGRSEARKAKAALTADDALAPGPEEDLAQRQAAELVQQLLAQLDPDQALVFYLAEIEGFTVPEIASSLGINLNTAYGRLRLSRRRFESLVKEHDRAPESK